MRRFLGGLVAGLGATLFMEYASSAIYERQSEDSRKQEEALRTEMPTTALVRKTAAAVLGADLSDAAVEKAGMVAHYAFGAAGGPVAQLLAGRGTDSLKAAVVVAATMEVMVDQGANTALGLTAPSWRFPLIANVRGVAAHVVYGTALGLLLAAGDDCR